MRKNIIIILMSLFCLQSFADFGAKPSIKLSAKFLTNENYSDRARHIVATCNQFHYEPVKALCLKAAISNSELKPTDLDTCLINQDYQDAEECVINFCKRKTWTGECAEPK